MDPHVNEAQRTRFYTMAHGVNQLDVALERVSLTDNCLSPAARTSISTNSQHHVDHDSIPKHPNSIHCDPFDLLVFRLLGE